MPGTIHRTAVFALHQPTRHVRAALEQAFRAYTRAYTEILYTCGRYSPDQLRALATFATDERTGHLRMSARALSKRLFDDADIACRARAVCVPLEGRLRQSVREHVAQTLMSYVALLDAQTADATRRGPPTFPSRLRPHDVEQHRARAGRAGAAG